MVPGRSNPATSTLRIVTSLTSYRTILFAPFVPFIVLFCQVIETQDREDLARLQSFVASLQLEIAVTEPIDKLRRLFQVLYNVASYYVESQTGARGEDQQQSNAEVDAYLAALGFSSQASAEQQHETQYLVSSEQGVGESANLELPRSVNPMIWMGNGAQLEDWLWSNEHMVSFLEDSSFDTWQGR